MDKNNIELSILPLGSLSSLSLNGSLDNSANYANNNNNNNNTHEQILIKQTTGKIPKICYLLCTVEFAERLSYYLISGCLTNMIQRFLPLNSTTGSVLNYNSDETPGALGLGLPIASFTMQLLTCISYLSPLISGYLSDTKLGKWKSIWLGIWFGIVGHFLLVISALPIILQQPWISYLIIIISIFTIAISAGFIKPNILPLLLDQYNYSPDKSDQMMDIDGTVWQINHQETLEKMSMTFYAFINWGCCIAIVGSFLERKFGFWFVYMIAAFIYSILPFIMYYLKPRLNYIEDKSSPIKSELYTELYQKVKGYIFNKNTLFINNGQIPNEQISPFITLIILFLFFIPFYLNDLALTPLQISMAATMKPKLPLPNDFYQLLNPLTIIIALPLISNIIYPILQLNFNGKFYPSIRSKIFIGFMLVPIGSLFGLHVQYRIYKNSECGYNATNCHSPANVSIFTWIEYLLMFTFQALGECLAVTTTYELSYQYAPNGCSSFIISLFLTMVAFGSILGEIGTIWWKDPFLINVWCSCLMLALFSGILFWLWRPKYIL